MKFPIWDQPIQDQLRLDRYLIPSMGRLFGTRLGFWKKPFWNFDDNPVGALVLVLILVVLLRISMMSMRNQQI